MQRPNNLNHEYLADRIAKGFDVLVPGHGVIRNIAALPSQEILDRRLPATPNRQSDDDADGALERYREASAKLREQELAGTQATAVGVPIAPAAVATPAKPASPSPRSRRGSSN